MSLRQSHLSGLDGLRALAVLSVVAYHLGYGWSSGGFLGVDLFFVLSGFLITTLLLEEKSETDRISLISFWRRRARRLLPALFVMVSIVVLFPWLMTEWGHATAVATLDVGLLRGFAFSSFFYVANWFAISSGHSYFAQFAAPSPLAHTWSLGIEEQFYLVWPFVIYGLTRGGVAARRRLGAAVSATIALASSVLMLVLFHAGNESSLNFVYNATFTRFFDLGVGATLAWLVVGRPPAERWRRHADVVGFAALGGLLYFMATAGTSSGVPKNFMFDGGFLGCAILAALVVAAIRFESTFLAKLFSLSPLRAIGRASYGLYLWHWPIIVYVTPALVHVSGHRLLVVRLVLMAAFTTASYFLIELPIRERRWPIPARRVIAGVGTVATISLIAVVASASIYPIPNVTAELARYAPASPPAGSGEVYGSVALAKLSSTTYTPHHRLRVLFLGDSVAYYSGSGLAAALNALPDVRASVQAFPGWGVRERSYWKYFLDKVLTYHPAVVLLEAQYDNIFAWEHPLEYRGLLDDFTQQLFDDHVKAVLYVTTPLDHPPPGSGLVGAKARSWERLFNAANAAWQVDAHDAANTFSGRSEVLDVASAVELHGQFSAWLPPPTDPTAAKSSWDRVRMVDNTHLCPVGTELYGVAVAQDVANDAGLGPAKVGWWLGTWSSRRIKILPPSPTSCPVDHP